MAKTVILIDDDQDDLDIIKEILNSIDPTLLCISFIYPVEAIRVITTELTTKPDYVFTDNRMPGMNGAQCVEKIRKKEEFNETVITVLSTALQPEDAAILKRAGADYIFKKPSTEAEYKLLLLSVLQRRQFLSEN